MRRLALVSLLWCAVASLVLSLSSSPFAPATTPALPFGLDEYARPLAFQPNVGQTDSIVRFLVESLGGRVFFTPDEVVFALPASPTSAPDAAPPVVRQHFVDANPATQISGDAPTAARVNYVLGAEPQQWRTDVPSYAGLTYHELYPGISVSYQGSNGRIKSVYSVAPHADPTRIRWRYQDARDVAIASDGSLQITVADDYLLREAAPIAWQARNGRNEPVAVRYAKTSTGALQFDLGSYDPARPLIIDPELTYSTYLGGSGLDTGFNLHVDAAGFAYLVGETFSPNFPRAGGSTAGYAGNYDAFVAKLDITTGSLIYTTYVGGSSDDRGRGIAVDSTGAAIISGYTTSMDFPTVRPLFSRGDASGNQDGFVARLSPAGDQLDFSTYLGGNVWDQATRVAVDAADAIYITGATASSTFPTTAAAFQRASGGSTDAFIVKLTAAASAVVYSTYVGGAGDDAAFGIAVDGAGQPVITGRTTSSAWPTTVGAAQRTLRGGIDLFVTQLAAAGTTVASSTLLGGAGDDQGYAITLDAAGNRYLTGGTASANFPVTANVLQPTSGGGVDVFVAQIRPDATLGWSTYLGGSANEDGLGIAVDSTGQATVTGSTFSANFPLNQAIGTRQAGADVFVSALGAGGATWRYSTYLGGSGDDIARGVQLDPDTGAAVITGETQSATNIVRCTAAVCPPAAQPVYAGGRDAFVVRIMGDQPPTPTPTNTATATPTPINTATATPAQSFLYLPSVANAACFFLYCPEATAQALPRQP